MMSILDRIFGRQKRGSGATAKDRLRFVLQHDRINLPPERMEEMKRDILAVIVKYVVVDRDNVEIALEQRDRSYGKLVAEIPFLKETVPPSPTAEANTTEAESSDAKATENGQSGAEQNANDQPDDEESAGEAADENDEKK